MKKWLKRISIAILALCLSFGAAVCTCWFVVEKSNARYIFNSCGDVPHNKVGLVLGTSKYNRYGRTNLFFKYRMDAAAALYKAGKVDYLVVSGDNHIAYYDEPTDMKKALISRGVPDSCIVCDYAGFRTFDSVVRLKEVFDEESVTIISQPYHNKRALYIARAMGMNAVSFNAKDVKSASPYFTYVREAMARVAAVLDVHVLNTKPKFLGDKIHIGQS